MTYLNFYLPVVALAAVMMAEGALRRDRLRVSCMGVFLCGAWGGAYEHAQRLCEPRRDLAAMPAALRAAYADFLERYPASCPAGDRLLVEWSPAAALVVVAALVLAASAHAMRRVRG